MNLLKIVSKAFRLGAPPPKLTVSEWAAKHRVLSRKASAEPGPWDDTRAPYQREMMDCLNDPAVELVVYCTSSQVGKTECLGNILGYHVDRDPAPVLVVLPTVELAEAWSKDRLSPMLEDSPRLASLVQPSRSRDSGNTVLHKQYPGGFIQVVGANAPAGLSARPIRIVLMDEIDRYPQSAGTEGDPVMLARRRTDTFWNRKILMTSTPTIRGFSRIEKAFEESDQRRYFVPCPRCGVYQTLTWGNLQWPRDEAGKDLTEQAAYRCPECGEVIREEEKHVLLNRGEWRPTAAGPTAGKVRGFAVNTLYSPWRTWAELAAEWVEVHKDPVRLQVFINTVLGEPWEEQGDGIEPDSLLGRVEDYRAEVPHGVGILTGSVDVQKDRLEVQIMGWGAGEECWLVEFQQIHGDPGGQAVWDDLDSILCRRFRHESGASVPVSMTFIDAGSLHCDEVYRFCLGRQGKRVYPCKGHSKPGAELVSRPSRNNRFRVKLFMVGTDTAKDTVFSRLRVREPGPGYLHLPGWADGEWVAQLTAEKLVRRFIRGRGSVRQYTKTRARNEALDLTVYSLAALHSLGSGTVKELGERATRLSRWCPSGGGPAAEPGAVEVADGTVRKWNPYRGTRPGGGWITNW